MRIDSVPGHILTYTDQDLPSGVTHTYTVRAGASSEHSEPAYGQTQPEFIAPPVLQAPTNLRAVNRTYNSITLNWNLPSSTANIQGYRVFRNNTLVHTTSNNTTTGFTDTGLATNRTFTYRVPSFNNQGSKEASTRTINTSTTAVPTSNYPAWSSTATYVSGDRIVYNGSIWRAEWWT